MDLISSHRSSASSQAQLSLLGCLALGNPVGVEALVLMGLPVHALDLSGFSNSESRLHQDTMFETI